MMNAECRIAFPYVYRWGVTAGLAEFKGRRCRVLRRGKLNSALVEFADGTTHVISRNALARALPRVATEGAENAEEAN